MAELIIKQPTVIMAKNGKREEGPMGTIGIENMTFAYPSKKDVTVVKNFTINVASN